MIFNSIKHLYFLTRTIGQKSGKKIHCFLGEIRTPEIVFCDFLTFLTILPIPGMSKKSLYSQEFANSREFKKGNLLFTFKEDSTVVVSVSDSAASSASAVWFFQSSIMYLEFVGQINSSVPSKQSKLPSQTFSLKTKIKSCTYSNFSILARST